MITSIQQGKIAEKKEIARQLFKKGVEKEIIKFSTGLSDEELNQLI